MPGGRGLQVTHTTGGQCHHHETEQLSTGVRMKLYYYVFYVCFFQLLAIGTSKGMLEVYNCSEDILKVVSKVLAHPPKQGPQDKRFGQLTKQ